MMAVSLDTRLTELLGCQYPIVQTAMGWVADPNLVAGTCNAGGFGFLAGATIPPAEMERDILRTKALTDKPFGVNFHMYQPNANAIVDLVIEHGVRAVSYSRSPGKAMIARLKDAGKPFLKEAAMAKLFSSQVAERVASKMVEIHGGNGFTTEYPAEKFFRDSKIGQIYEGTSDVQKIIIQRALA